MSNKEEKQRGLQVFNFNKNEGATIRVQVKDGNPWFVAKDVCRVLDIANHIDAVSRLDDDEKGGSVLPTQFGEKEINMVSESGLYHLIFQSRKPEAKKFRKWVTGEVLPALRKTGRYEMAKASMDSDSVDLRDQPYEQLHYMDGLVRVVMLDGEAWYSINDIHRCIGSRTESSQSVKRLNAKRELAKKIFLFGMTHPGWFTTKLGVQLILSASQKMKGSGQLMLDFKDEEGK